MRTLALSALLLTGCLAEAGGASGAITGGLCDDTCPWANDGACEDGASGSFSDRCAYGTDCGDCGERAPLPAVVVIDELCSNTCDWADDGECDDGGDGATAYCPLGTDCGDCGTRVVEAVGPDPACNETCAYSNDGVCDDGGASSEFDYCALGSDCTDCGRRSM